MARQRRNIEALKRGMFGKEIADNSQKRKHDIRNNEMVDIAEKYVDALPAFLKKPGAQEVADGVVTLQYLPTDRRAQLAAGGVLGTAAFGALAQAYQQQASEFGPTDPIAVAGRAISNVNPYSNSGSVGGDALAQARNNVSAARQLVGSEEVLEALTDDEIRQLRAEQAVASKPMDYQAKEVQGMIDERVAYLMQTPIVKSDGGVAPMPFDQANRIATEQVAMELRAGQVY